MPKCIHKFPLDVKDAQSFHMSAGAKLLTVQLQVIDGPVLWAEVTVGKDVIRCYRHIGCVGTGMFFPDTPQWGNAIYIGTVQINSFVWHFYDLGEVKA